MPRNRFDRTSTATEDRDSITTLWCLRLLVNGRGHRAFFTRHGYASDELAALCNLPAEEGYGRPPSVSPAVGLRYLRQSLRRLEENPPEMEHVLAGNVWKVGDRLGLTALERETLAFLTLLTYSSHIEEAAELAIVASRGRAEFVLASALGHSVEEAEACLGPRGLLLRSGLLRRQEGPLRGFKVELLPRMADVLLRTTPSEDPFSPFFHEAHAPTVTVSDMPHLKTHLGRMEAVLRKACEEQRRGINVLLYGPPGTGKTEFARLLAGRLGMPLQEISHTDDVGMPVAPRDRLGAWHLCQHLIRRQEETLVLFDEIEDAFSEVCAPRLLRERPFHAGKAWLNHSLEQNPVPSIWIANRLDGMDPAYLRRFTMVLEVGAPPQAIRRRIVNRSCEAVKVSNDWKRRIARHPSVTPAQIRRIAEVASLAGDALETEEREGFMDDQLSCALRLQGQKPLPGKRHEPLPWSIELLQSDYPVDALFKGLRRGGRGTVLLYGPPGTGKTALASALAQFLERPLLRKGASELLAPFVGLTERNISGMFSEAARQDAVLLLDEADSLLRSRERAQTSWEVTQVNEMLTCMEDFDGIFVCATNCLAVTDHAALRRFDCKVRLDYPGADRRWELFLHLLRAIDLPVPGGGEARAARQRIDALDNLAPGDFATIARKHARLGEEFDLIGVLSALESESRFKPDAPRAKVGFV